MTWLYWPHCITVYEMLLWINDILTFLVLFLIWCLLLRACPCWLKKKKPKKKRLFIKSDLISSMYVYSRFTIKDCSSSQFSGSRLQSQHITIFHHITIHRQQKKCWITGSQKWARLFEARQCLQKKKIKANKEKFTVKQPNAMKIVTWLRTK